MDTKKMLKEQLEREYEYQRNHEVGTEEYNASLGRLTTLQTRLTAIEESERDAAIKEQTVKEDKKDRVIKNVLEGIKTTSGIVLPIIGLVVITAVEKETTFTGSLKDITKLFLPKKL